MVRVGGTEELRRILQKCLWVKGFCGFGGSGVRYDSYTRSNKWDIE